MELYQLRTFIAVAEEGHLTRAAKRIHASQSTVSAQIRALEDMLGVPLFRRTAKGMDVTPEGMRLLEKARQTVLAADGLLGTAKDLREDVHGAPRVGLNLSDNKHLRTTALTETLRQSHPGVVMHFIQSNSTAIAKDVLSGHLDGGFLYGDDYPGLDVTVLEQTPLRIIAPPDWKEKVENATCEELSDMPWVWTPNDCPFNPVVQKLVTPKAVTVADNESLLLALVASGTGLAMLREDDALAAARENMICLWSEPLGSIPLSFATHGNRNEERLIQALTLAVRTTWNMETNA